jgi:glycosyltransferase involved in cell wall biosynthesis
MKKKLIIFIPSIEGGGVEKNMFIVSNYLAQRIKVSVLTISKKFQKKLSNNVNFITLKSNFWERKSRRIKYFLSIILLLHEILKDKNLVVFAFQANIYCIILCKIFNIKIIVRSNSAPIGWTKNLVKKKLFKFFINKADRVMVNSFEFKKDLKKEFNVNSKCIYNPLDLENIIKKSKKKSRKYFKNKKKKILKILNIGRFTDQKDQITLIKSLNIIKSVINFEAIIVGKGILKSNLKEYINRYKLSKKIKIVNFLENPYPLIKQTELFILSSKFEGLPNVLLESLALRKFVISSNCRTGPKEILLNGKGGLLFKVGDYEELSKKIIYYHKNKKNCVKLLKHSINKLDRFDYHKNLKEYYNFVTSVK